MTKLSSETAGVQLLAMGAFILVGIAFLGVVGFIAVGGHNGAAALYLVVLAALISLPAIVFGLVIRLRRMRDAIGTRWVDIPLALLVALVVCTTSLFLMID
jgi:hypothetical protein